MREGTTVGADSDRDGGECHRHEYRGAISTEWGRGRENAVGMRTEVLICSA